MTRRLTTFSAPAENRPSRAQTNIDVSSFSEGVIGVLLGVVLYLLEIKDLAGVSILLGPALSISRYLITRQVREEMAEVHTLAAVVDLQRAFDAEQLRDMLRAYLEITEDEFRPVKKALLQEVTLSLRKLATQNVSDELTTGAYYKWLLPMLEAAGKGNEIWAVSMMLDVEWIDSPYEEKFLQLNLDAAKKGCVVERIFVIDRAKVTEALSNKGFAAHIANAGDYLRPLLVFRDDVAKTDPQLLKALGDGVIAFDRRVALIDLSSPEGMRGYVTMSSVDIDHWRSLFEQLRVHGRPLDPTSVKSLAPPPLALPAGNP